MNKENIIFEHSDAWILLAIFLSEKTDLEGIIGTADMINHAIPTKDEIECAINKSIKAGIIEIEEDKYKFTDYKKSEIEEVVNKNRDVLKTWENLEKYLNNNLWPKSTSREYKITFEEVKKAYNNYIKILE